MLHATPTQSGNAAASPAQTCFLSSAALSRSLRPLLAVSRSVEAEALMAAPRQQGDGLRRLQRMAAVVRLLVVMVRWQVRPGCIWIGRANKGVPAIKADRGYVFVGGVIISSAPWRTAQQDSDKIT